MPEQLNGKTQPDHGARRMVLEAIGNPRKEAQYGEYDWPYMMDRTGAKQDMRRMLSLNTKVKEIQYAKEMLSGWCALTQVKERIGFGLIFDLKVFPTLYLFSSFGGWGDQQMIIMEPCTGYPLHVNEGIKQGTHQILKAGQSLETDITAVIYEGVASVSSIDSEGNIS